MIDYAFAEMGVHKIFAETIDCVKSVSLMKKLGMRPEGIPRGQTRDNHGNWADLYLYGLLAFGELLGIDLPSKVFGI